MDLGVEADRSRVMSEMNKSQKSAVHNVHLMFTPKRAQVFVFTFMIGALGRSMAIGLGLPKVAALLGLVGVLAVLYGGLWYLLAPTVEDRLFRPLQRYGGLIMIVVWLIFSFSLVMELLAAT
jgi:hypothetical protein